MYERKEKKTLKPKKKRKKKRKHFFPSDQVLLSFSWRLTKS